MRSKSSDKWLKQHFKDPFVKQSWQDGYRSRAAYKLLEINEKNHILKSKQKIVDLGAAPGGWLQVAKKISRESTIIGLDILNIEHIDGVQTLQGDFTENDILEELLKVLDNNPLDLVLSDMAPNLSGIPEVDIPKSMYLSELAFDFADLTLRKGGNLLIKVFQGAGFEQLLKKLRQNYTRVISIKPKSSRSKSKEFYLLCREKKFNSKYN